MTTRKEVSLRVQQLMETATFNVRTLAERLGMPYDTVRAWGAGKRLPSRANREKMADTMEAHGRRMIDSARELREMEPPRTEAE